MDVTAILVTYEPDRARLEATLRLLADASCPAVVVDNSETPGTPGSVRETCERRAATYLGGTGNIGIAAAQNLAISHVARQRREGVLVFLDQDSDVPPGMIARLHAAYRELRALDPRAAIVGALAVADDGSPLPFQEIGRVGPFLRAEAVISSGSMIAVDDLVASGGLREDLFIDLVDNELCWRLARRGRHSYVDPRIPFHHTVGTGRRVSALGRSAPVSAPVRGYYQTRNLILLGRSRTLPWPSVARRLVLRLGAIALAAVSHGAGAARMRLAWKGVVDGCRGRGGRLREE